MCYNHIYLFRSLFFCKDFFHKAVAFNMLSYFIGQDKYYTTLSREALLPKKQWVKFSVIREVPL